MSKRYQRTPKGYDGTDKTTRGLNELLPAVLHKIQETYHDRPDLVLASWPDIIGAKLASMTQAVSFLDGVLTVKVKNSTLHSLLNQNEKPQILRRLTQRFPNAKIRSVVFRLG